MSDKTRSAHADGVFEPFQGHAPSWRSASMPTALPVPRQTCGRRAAPESR